MKNNAATLIQNETLLGHVITIGQDFDNYGGDIPVAICQMAYYQYHKPKNWRARQGWCMSKIHSAPDLAKRGQTVTAACFALIDEANHEDWLIDALTAYYGQVQGLDSARDRASSSYRSAGMQLIESKDDPWLSVRVTLSAAWTFLTCRAKDETQRAARRFALAMAWVAIAERGKNFTSAR